MSFLESFQQCFDLSDYLAERFPTHFIAYMKEEDDMVAVWYWLARQNMLKILSKVALRVFATPVSSSASERDFSFVHLLVSSDRNPLADDSIADLVYTLSALYNGWRPSNNNSWDCFAFVTCRSDIKSTLSLKTRYNPGHTVPSKV